MSWYLVQVVTPPPHKDSQLDYASEICTVSLFSVCSECVALVWLTCACNPVFRDNLHLVSLDDLPLKLGSKSRYLTMT